MRRGRTNKYKGETLKKMEAAIIELCRAKPRRMHELSKALNIKERTVDTVLNSMPCIYQDDGYLLHYSGAAE